MALSKIRSDSLEDTAIHGNRNLIINGAMQVAQRGTSSTSSGYQTVDRFNVHKSSFGQLAFTQTQVTDAPAGFSNSYKFTTTTAETAVDAAESLGIRTALEGQDLQQLGYGTGSAKKLTLSFYVKSSQTGTFAIYFYSADTVRIITRTYTISSANTWEQKSVTIDGDASGSIDNDANESFQISWCIAAGSNFTSSDSTSWSAYSTANTYFGHAQNAVVTTTNATWQITGVQLEVGEQRTPFEHRSYGDELARCQRYFQIVGNSSYFAGNGVGSASISTGIPLATPMRAEPSVPDTGYAFHRSGNTNSGTNSVTNVTYATIGASNLQLRVNFGSGISDEVAYVLNAITADLQLTAEL